MSKDKYKKDKKHRYVGQDCTLLRHREHISGRGCYYFLSSAGNFMSQNKDLLQNAASAVSFDVRAGLDIKDVVKKKPVVDYNTNDVIQEIKKIKIGKELNII